MWSALAACVDLAHALFMAAWVLGLPLLFLRRWPTADARVRALRDRLRHAQPRLASAARRVLLDGDLAGLLGPGSALGGTRPGPARVVHGPAGRSRVSPDPFASRDQAGLRGPHLRHGGRRARLGQRRAPPGERGAPRRLSRCRTPRARRGRRPPGCRRDRTSRDASCGPRSRRSRRRRGRSAPSRCAGR